MDVHPPQDWHTLDAEACAAKWQTSLQDGLAPSKALERLAETGPNQMPEHKGPGPVRRFLSQFHNPLIYLLLLAGGVTLALHEWVDSGVILGVVLLNAIIGFVQEAKAIEALGALKKTMGAVATVLRGSDKKEIDAKELVPGDVVIVGAGEKVPADIRIFETDLLEIDESALTGESVPAQKREGNLPPETPLAERTNMAYASTLVTKGAGRGIVVATGTATEVGRISRLIASAEVLATPLTRKIESFSRLLLILIVLLAAGTFAIGLLRGQGWVEVFLAAVALSVAAIPEGLPAAVTITLAIGVSRMARRNAIIRRLPAVETLGSTTVICTDKTGTLTENAMTVMECWTADLACNVTGAGYDPEGEFQKSGQKLDPTRSQALYEMLRCGVLCNDAILKKEDGHWDVNGDPTEGCLLTSGAKAGLTFRELSNAYPRLDALPFESQNRYMATLHDEKGKRSVYIKGSVDRILDRCEQALNHAGKRVALDKEKVLKIMADYTDQGLRVLAFGRKEMPAGKNELEHADLDDGVLFLGLQAVMDPPRESAARAVLACQQAGIRVKMITGDHARTARAIAARIGMGGTENPALTGRDLETLSDEALADAAEKTAVFARVTPEEKLRLVKGLQSRGQVVAMTGDGVNDAAALRRADIGISMGITGTEVAKETADMVLTDDNFATIEAAVEEGRGVFDNLVKFIVWTLPTNIGQGLTLLLAILMGLALPLLPVQVLWINMTTAVFLGLMLAFEPKEPGLMHRPPRNPNAPILSPRLIFRMLFTGALLVAGAFGAFQWQLAQGASEALARTVAVNVFITGQAFFLLNCRSMTRSCFSLGLFSNMAVWAGIAIMAALQLLFTYAPFMQAIFSTRPLGAREWCVAGFVGLALFVLVEVEKHLFQARPDNHDAQT